MQVYRLADLGQEELAGYPLSAALSKLQDQRLLDRIWAHDYTVWKPEPDGITNRLGWLHIADAMLEQIDCLEALADEVCADGYTDALLLGMGGSSLAPEVFAKVAEATSAAVVGASAKARPDHARSSLALAVLDSTDPAAILYHANRLDPARTLFIVSTKSGNTVETLSMFKFFYNRAAEVLGVEDVGQHFVAITDPGSKLAALAQECSFRTTLLNDPNIGGRYSALSFYGLFPAALVGWDLERLLARATVAASECEAKDDRSEGVNGRIPSDCLALGTVLGTWARAGRDKLTLALSPSIASLGDWIEQLIAESTGKQGPHGAGLGIVPVVGEPIGSPDVYGDDRLFVYMRLEQGTSENQALDNALQVLADAGYPVIRIDLHDVYDLGKQLFLWEMATAVAGHLLGINPFDQPNVEAAKALARQLVAEYVETGSLPSGKSVPASSAALQAFLTQARPGDYIALQAYVQPTAETDAALLALRTRLRDCYRLTTTVGYGPRFLHSTGQLHKGDRGNGLFVQLIADDPCDIQIPDEAGLPESSITFSILKSAQALGDWLALRDAGRRVIRLYLGEDISGSIRRLANLANCAGAGSE